MIISTSNKGPIFRQTTSFKRLKPKTRGGFPVVAKNGPSTNRIILLASGILGIENPLTLVLWEQRNVLGPIV